MTDKEWQKLLRKVAEDIYEGKRKGTIDDKMVRETARKLMHGVEEGYGASLNDEDVAGKKYDTLRKMQKDVYHFSGAKNWNQLREMSLLLNNAKGGMKTFEEYYRAVQQIDETYNKIYLRSEYENAVASAQMASKWDEIVADADTLPYLQYDAVMDERTRLTHREMHGIVLRWDDDFWQTYYPPNDWGCRCDVRQLDDAEVTDITKLKLKPNPPMFRNNVGVGGQVFSDIHPYYKSIPEDVRKDILIATEKLLPKNLRSGYAEEYKNKDNGARLLVHQNADKQGLTENIQYGKVFVDEGYNVKILEHSFVQNIKNPEVTIDEVLCDFKTPENHTKTSIQSQVKRAKKQQADAVAIYIDKQFKPDEIITGLENAYGKYDGWDWNKAVKTIFLFNTTVVKIKRSEVISGAAKTKINAFIKKKKGG